MLIFWNLSLSFVLLIRESGSYENGAVFFSIVWMHGRQTEKERKTFLVKEKHSMKYKIKVVTAALFRFTKTTNNGREKSWSKLALFIISTVWWFGRLTAFEFIELLFFEQTWRSHSADQVSSISMHEGKDKAILSILEHPSIFTRQIYALLWSLERCFVYNYK